MPPRTVARATYISSTHAPSTAARPRDWRDSAGCRDEDPELFFPIGNAGPALLQIDEAKAVCRRCPVMERCLQWALDTGETSGVWGGLAEAERRSMRRRASRDRARAVSQ